MKMGYEAFIKINMVIIGKKLAIWVGSEVGLGVMVGRWAYW